MTSIVGLTGSIGMGKSTTAKLFAEEGCDVWDADAAVHRLYSKDGDAVVPIQQAFPEAIENGSVSRGKLKEIFRAQPDAFRELERIVHPLVTQDRASFLSGTKSDIVVLDIPLLFETGADKIVDLTVCVSIDASSQKARVMSRGHMTLEDFEAILIKQMPDAEKRAKADYVIETSTIEAARAQVRRIVQNIREGRHA